MAGSDSAWSIGGGGGLVSRWPCGTLLGHLASLWSQREQGWSSERAWASGPLLALLQVLPVNAVILSLHLCMFEIFHNRELIKGFFF